MTSLLLLSLLAAAPTHEAVERVVRDRFEAVGRTLPPVDPSLTAAAEQLAHRALEHGVEDATGLMRVTSAISRQRGWDPSPVVVALRASTGELLGELQKQDLGTEPSTHLGVGLAVGEERSAVIVLLARRKIELEPFARTWKKPVGPQRLCGQLVAPLATAELFVTRPGGAVERLPMHREAGALCGALDFSSPGRHSVEVLASGPRGPEVAALFFVDVGAITAEHEDALVEPTEPRQIRAALTTRINALRLQMGLQAVRATPALDEVAQAWAERLAHDNFFAHVSPDGSTLKQRLAEVGYRYLAAGENLGLSSGPLAAHFGIEHSPGHRNNLLEPDHRELGLGLARRSDGLLVLVEVLAAPAPPDVADPLAALYASLADERKKLGLPVLARDEALERLAQAHVRAALKADVPRSQVPGAPRIAERAFELLPDVKSIAVDVLVADTPRVHGSKNLAASSSGRVGVGVVKGDSARYGPGRYWIVVIYGAT